MDISVVIPTHDRPEKLQLALDRLELQRSAPRFELIVVANAGDDPGPVTGAIGERPFPVRQLEATVAGASAARNAGWRAARSELILFLGDDILASPALLCEHLEWHSSHPAEEVGVLGHVRWARQIEVTPFMRWLERGMQFDYEGIDGIEAGPGRLYTANVSLKRGMLERVDGFDEGLPFLFEDIELGYRLFRHDFRLLYNADADAEHLHEITLESWKRRMEVAARGEHALTAKHPEIEPEMLERLRRAAAAPPARGRAAKLVAVVPRWVPFVGPVVWKSAEQRWLQAIAPGYIRAWEEEKRGIEVG